MYALQMSWIIIWKIRRDHVPRLRPTSFPERFSFLLRSRSVRRREVDRWSPGKNRSLRERIVVKVTAELSLRFVTRFKRFSPFPSPFPFPPGSVEDRGSTRSTIQPSILLRQSPDYGRARPSGSSWRTVALVKYRTVEPSALDARYIQRAE